MNPTGGSHARKCGVRTFQETRRKPLETTKKPRRVFAAGDDPARDRVPLVPAFSASYARRRHDCRRGAHAGLYDGPGDEVSLDEVEPNYDLTLLYFQSYLHVLGFELYRTRRVSSRLNLAGSWGNSTSQCELFNDKLTTKYIQVCLSIDEHYFWIYHALVRPRKCHFSIGGDKLMKDAKLVIWAGAIALAGLLLGMHLGSVPALAACPDNYSGECEAYVSFYNDCACDAHGEGCSLPGPPYYVCWFRACTHMAVIGAWCSPGMFNPYRRICAPFDAGNSPADCPCLYFPFCVL